MKAISPDKQLNVLLAKYSTAMVRLARAVLAKMRKLVPGAVELVYDNYNALVIGFGPTDRAGDAPLSIALYPKWINLFFLQGVKLPDPQRLLKGSGVRVRSIRIKDASELDKPAIRAMIAAAIDRTATPFENAKRRLLIKSVAEVQRPRRPK